MMLIKLWYHLSRRRQRQFYFLLFMMLIASVSEVISIGAVVPFLGALTAPEHIYQHELMQPLIQILDVKEPNQLVLPLTVMFIFAVIIANIIRLTLLYVMTRLSFSAGSDLSINIYRRTLYQNYSTHISRNSSEIINGIITKTNVAIGVIRSVLTLISSVVILVSIIALLFKINMEVALTVSIGFGLFYLAVVFYTRKQLKENSQSIADQSSLMIKALQEGLGGIRDVLIDGSQKFYCQVYRNADQPFRRASGNNAFISASPRYVVEAIGMSLIAGVAYLMTLGDNGINTVIPVLGALALGAQRMLPALQQVYGAYSSINGSKASFKDVLTLLDQPLPNNAHQPLQNPISFKQKIELKNLSFRYAADSPWVLKNINLKLIKGSRIGFMGVTGSGKSTLLDIIMGLLPQSEGELNIDNQPVNDKNRRSWQVHIAHVPQNIYLSDSSIEENIAFGISKEEIDHQQVEKAAQQAQIAELIAEWKDGYQTRVGERGVCLSGGQRQRIGIARALYKQANVLILDEATSALDDETEQAVMEAIEGLERELTILIIAHRLTTLKGCDQIVKLGKDYEFISGSYQELINAKD